MTVPAIPAALLLLPACACGRQGKTSRLPAGWKRYQEAVWCDRCWRQRYLLRAVTLPVSKPATQTWEELRALLKPLWAETTRASNWMTTEFYARDARRAPGAARLGPMPKIYLYPEARKKFPGLPPQSVAAIEHAVGRRYRARRYQVLWTAEASLANYRYPTPFPVHNQSWKVAMEGASPVVTVRLGEGERSRLVLKSGPQFGRQLASVRSIASGAAAPGELALYQQGRALMCKMVAWLPRPQMASQRGGVLKVRTAVDNLLTAVNVKDEALWRYNGDHLRRWVAEHRSRLQRWSEDSKYEQRPVPAFAARRLRAVEKFRRRMQAASHEIAAQLTGYAARRRFAVVEYDDGEKSFCLEFPWARLRQLVGEKLDAAKIELKLIASEEGAAKPPPESRDL